MVWCDLSQTLITIMVVSLWRSKVYANIPLISDDVPEDEREETIRRLQDSMLKALGMKDRPKEEKQIPIVPQFMMDLYNQQTEDPDYMSLNFNRDHTLNANTARSFAHIGTKSHTQNTNIVNLYFNVTELPSDENLVTAELQLSRHNNTKPDNGIYRLEVHELIARPHSVEEAITRLIDTKIISGTDDQWHHLDITAAASRARRHKNRLFGIQLRLKCMNSEKTIQEHLRVRRDASSTEQQWNSQKPHVVIYTFDTKHPTRTKRGAGGKRKGRRGKANSKQINSQCQRHPMEVSFAEVGWKDWILAPPGYPAFFCHGECNFPLSVNMNTTNHAVIQTVINAEDPEAAPRACCVPTELSPVSLLYTEEQTVILKNYREMIVTACGCR